MPYGDGTGPDGRGSFTGRGMGYCAGNDRPGCYEPSFGYGRGRGFGRGRGRGRGFGMRPVYGQGVRIPYFHAEPEVSREDQEQNTLSALQRQQAYLQEQLENISQQIAGLSKAKESK